MSRRAYAPAIESINANEDTGREESLRNTIESHLKDQGYSNTRVNFVRTSSRVNSTKINIRIKNRKDKSRIKEYSNAMGGY